MTDPEKLRNIEIRSIAKKHLNEREPDLRTVEPLPEDYEAFREEVQGEASDEEVRRFGEEWADVYREINNNDYR